MLRCALASAESVLIQGRGPQQASGICRCGLIRLTDRFADVHPLTAVSAALPLPVNVEADAVGVHDRCGDDLTDGRRVG